MDAGFKIIYGDLDFDKGGAPFEIKNRDQNFVSVLDSIVAKGGKPILFVGSLHVPDLAERYYNAGKKEIVYPYFGPHELGQLPCSNNFYISGCWKSLGLYKYFKHIGID